MLWGDEKPPLFRVLSNLPHEATWDGGAVSVGYEQTPTRGLHILADSRRVALYR